MDHKECITLPDVFQSIPYAGGNGLLLMMGQISGIAFIIGMDALKSPATGSMTQSLAVLIGLKLCRRLRESALIAGAPGS